MIDLIVLMVLIGLFGGASTWAKHQRVKRMYEAKYRDCECQDKQEKVK